jgi:hypothetical protein
MSVALIVQQTFRTTKTVLTSINTVLNILCFYAADRPVYIVISVPTAKRLPLLRENYLPPTSAEQDLYRIYVLQQLLTTYLTSPASLNTDATVLSALIITLTMCVCWRKRRQPSIYSHWSCALQPCSIRLQLQKNGFSVDHSLACLILFLLSTIQQMYLPLARHLEINMNFWNPLTFAALGTRPVARPWTQRCSGFQCVCICMHIPLYTYIMPCHIYILSECISGKPAFVGL